MCIEDDEVKKFLNNREVKRKEKQNVNEMQLSTLSITLVYELQTMYNKEEIKSNQNKSKTLQINGRRERINHRQAGRQASKQAGGKVGRQACNNKTKTNGTFCKRIQVTFYGGEYAP